MTGLVRSARPKPASYRPSLDLMREALEGSRLAIARLISRAEAGRVEAAPALAELYCRGGNAHVIGITGVPGAGKSTLVSMLIRNFTAGGYKVGVVAVDPSSPFSGGAILGDRVRMSDAIKANHAFVRSMATRGHLGGLSRATLQAVDILDAAGYSPIIIETVGVGQDEVEIMTAAHTVVVLSPPGLGDDIQAIKAGILEIADIHVVSKADKPEAPATIAALKGMMTLGPAHSSGSWSCPVMGVSAASGEQVEALKEEIVRHLGHLHDSGEIATRRRKMCLTRIMSAARYLFQEKFDGSHGLASSIEPVIRREIDPESVARAMLEPQKESWAT